MTASHISSKTIRASYTNKSSCQPLDITFLLIHTPFQ
ncbi:hypothetical protein GECvBMG_gp109c [Salmonella phage GEC_vB_MG]|nr:hypothetical protein GECvBMG_gp109c [Salmonella phage GEC_vB_MG]